MGLFSKDEPLEPHYPDPPTLVECDPGMQPDCAPDFVVTLTPKQVADAVAYYVKQWRVPMGVRIRHHAVTVPAASATVKLWKET